MLHRLSKQWFETFLDTVPQSQTSAEVAFLARQLPLARFRHVLDLCCGPGRHAAPLARIGYQVTAVDLDPEVLARAPRVTPNNPRYLVADAGDLSSMDQTFDAVLILWQSFGYFDSEGNDQLLSAVADRLTERGRLVLDIYNRPFFETRQGVRRMERSGRTVVENKVMRGRRLEVTLDYGRGIQDRQEWELFSPEEIVGRTAGFGLRPRLLCSGFDEALAPSPESPRMQLVFERGSSPNHPPSRGG